MLTYKFADVLLLLPYQEYTRCHGYQENHTDGQLRVGSDVSQAQDPKDVNPRSGNLLNTTNTIGNASRPRTCMKRYQLKASSISY